MLFHEQPTDPWIDFDFMLVEAMQMLEDETCNECGNPVWVCRNEEASNVGFRIKITKCFAKAELDKWREAEEKKSSSKKHYGELPYIDTYTYDGSDLPTRDSYYQQLADKIE
jgi:hypothetical protein